MIALINKVTGTKMMVSEDRLDSYIAAGHQPVAAATPKATHEPVPSGKDRDRDRDRSNRKR